MKFNIRKIKLVSFLLSVIILSTTLNSSIFLNNNEIIDKATKDTKENVINTDPDGIHPIHTSSNSPPNANYFKFYKIITIDHNKVIGTENHTNFPLLISILDADLYDKVQSDGDDIAFSNGTDWLDHEIELFDQDYGTRYAKLVAWVRIPTLLHNKDTIIYMYYGNSTMNSRENPSSVWDANYKGVWHLSENPGPGYSGDIKDSTSNNNDGTAQASMTWNDQVEGKIDGSIDFDGSDDYITVPDSPNLDGSLNSTGEFTLVAWIYPRNIASFDCIMGTDKIRFCFDDYLYIILYNPNERSVASSSAVMNANEWQQVVATYKRTTGNVILYHNGVQVGSGTVNNANLDSSISFYIGEAYWWDFFHGIIDEVRVSNIVRSSQWIATCYENQNDPSSFYSISSRYEVNPPEPEEFNFYKKITINHNNVSGINDLIDFPLMISIIDADLHNKVQSDGDDIAFWNGSEWLHHEIEYFSQNYNSYYAKLVAWIRIPILSVTMDTVIYMYYGNPTMTSRQDPLGVWGNDYEAVWHLDESSGTGAYIQDSSPNYHDGTPTGTQYLSSGKIDGARNLVGNGDNYIVMDQGSEIFNGGNRFTFSFWIYLNYVSDAEWDTYGSREIFYKTTSVRLDRIWRSGTGRGSFQPDIEYVDHGTAYRSVYLYRQQWTYITYTYDGQNQRPYVNGQPSANIEEILPHDSNLVSDSSPFALGQYNTIKGYLDEFRVIKEWRSGDWIETEYNNQYNPNSFYNVSRAYKSRVPSMEDFEYFKEITIGAGKVSGNKDLIDFPLLISILDSDLKYDAQSDGDDILFSNGTEWLDHEIERYNPYYDSTKAQLIAWVRFPLLSYNTQTKIYMYYKNSTMQSLENPSGVWDNGYKGIYHLKGDPTQVLLDSTNNNNYGTSGGSMTSTDQVAANIDGGIDLDGSNDYFEISDPLETLVKKDMTISAWIFLKDDSDDWLSLSQRSDASETGFDWQFYARASDATPQYRAAYRTNDAGGGSEVVSNITLQTLKWYYLVGKNNGTHNFFYLNGYLTDISEETNSISDSDNDIWFGGNSVWGEYLQGIIDEVRVSNLARSSDWILTEFRNQNNPGTFYSVGPEMTGYSNIQVNALDLYNRPIPSANISIINNTKILQSKIADMYGSVFFTNFPKTKYYNFSVSITSNIQPYQTEIINATSEAILIDTPFSNITLKCNISRNIFYLEDLDGNPLDSGWIVVRHNSLYDSQNFQNCSVDVTGKATFRWLNTSGYHYTMYYQDNNYNPNKIFLASGEIPSVNSQINLIVNLTTVNFTVKTFDTKEPISGVKMLFYNTSSGKSVVNLTTDFNGFASFRWLNTSNFYNYSLRIRFYGIDWQFNMVGIDQPDPYVANFSIKAADAYVIEIQITQSELKEYETTLVSLNPKDNLVIEWGFNLTIRALFNVSKVPTGYETLLGPKYADSMTYEIYLESTLVKSGSMVKEDDYIGRYQCIIETYGLGTELLYTINIKGYKSEYVVPTDLQFSLYLLKNYLVLNQSENDDSLQTVYWLEIPEMSVKAYGEVSEELIIEDNIYYTDGAGNYDFQFSIPDLSMDWNLSQIVFNIYGVTFGVVEQNINLNITDPYSLKHKWDETNADYYYPSGDTGNGAWYDLIITLNKESPTNDNNFHFTIEGTFVGTVQINAEAIFRRNTINAEYYESNITDVISIPAYGDNGLAIKNITFEIVNCQILSGGLVDPATVIDNIITNEGYLVSTIYDNGTGYGKITIDDKMIYPLDNIFLFTIGNNTAIIFDVRIKIEYMQEFYKNDYLEVISYSKTVNNFASGDFSIGLTEEDLNDQGAFLYVKDLKVGSDSKYPTEVGMNITILGQTLNISDDPKRGSGTFLLENIMGFTKNKTYFAVIRTKQPVTFSLSFMIMYSRIVVNEIEGTVSYEIKGTDIGGTVQYNEDLRFYLQAINTTGIYARYESYNIEFIVTKDHYNSDVKQLELKVLERLTLISGSSANLDLYPVIYVQDELIFNFSFIDEQLQTKIIDLETQSYIMTKISAAGQSVPYGSGDLYINSDNEYVFDINTELLAVGRYTIWITLDKQNYESKQVIIFLTINEREIESELGKMFKEKQVNVVKGKIIILSIELTDPTRGDEPLTDADVILEIGDEEFEFDEVDDGIYELEFDTDKYVAFFTSNTITGTIKISKANYTSEDIDITIVIGMEELEVIPGVIKLPTFYFLLIIAAIIAIVGSLATYKYIQQMRIPKFVKKASAIRKTIKSSDEIDASILYPSKETYIISAVGDKWKPLGLSLESILGLKIKKSKKLIRSIPKIIIPDRTEDLIPLGLILMKWDPRTGTKILAKYPQDINISQKTLMQIYGTHEYTGESGTITLTVGTMNLLSYYTGPENAYYLILILNFDDDPDAYEGAMADILRIISQNLEDESYLQLIPSLFQRLSIFPSLTIEGHIAYTYQDEIKRMIINRLRDEGVISKSELIVWLKDKYKEGFIDFESILSDLMKMEIIKEASIKGIPSELIFLINDPFMLRIPPVQLLESPEKHGLPSYLSETYKTEVKKFFQNYHPLEQDNINIIDLIIDPQIYETLKLLRTAIITKNDLEKLKKKGVTDYNRVLKILWEKEIIKVFQDKAGNEYYALLTDFYLDIIFPKYLLNIIKNVYDQKSKDDRILIEYLKILEDFYIDIKSR